MARRGSDVRPHLPGFVAGIGVAPQSPPVLESDDKRSVVGDRAGAHRHAVGPEQSRETFLGTLYIQDLRVRSRDQLDVPREGDQGLGGITSCRRRQDKVDAGPKTTAPYVPASKRRSWRAGHHPIIAAPRFPFGLKPEAPLGDTYVAERQQTQVPAGRLARDDTPRGCALMHPRVAVRQTQMPRRDGRTLSG